MYYIQKINLNNFKTEYKHGDKNRIVKRGLGNVLTLLVLLQQMDKRNILPGDTIPINATVAGEAGSIGSIGYVLGDKLPVLQILNNLIVTSSPDSALAAGNIIFSLTNQRPSTYFAKLINDLTLTEDIARNITGRKNSKFNQCYTMSDLTKIGYEFSKLRQEYQNYLSVSEIVFNAKVYTNSSFLIKSSKIQFGYFFGDRHSEAVCFGSEDGQFKMYLVSGANGAFHRDYLIEAMIEEKNIGTINPDKVDFRINKDTIIMNIVGDTYPGEYYTTRRLDRNQWDPLDQEGYDYSFEKLRNFLGEADFNITNLEAALVDNVRDSSLFELKKFVLGGKPQETVDALKNAHIHAVTLANNHVRDFGAEGIVSTTENLKRASILYTGAGYNGADANEPIRLHLNGKKVLIYSAYWYRMVNHRQFQFYATPSNKGVNSIEGELLECIVNEKKQNPNCFILVSPHWGVDYNMVKPLQINLARQMIDAGADLIIGHGPHTLQKIESYKDIPIIYSIGNGFFNSDGEYDGYPESIPYGIIARIIFEKDNYQLRLYPIYTNNRDTKWQPDLVNEADFKDVVNFLHKNKSDLSSWKENTIGTNYLYLNQNY